MAKLFMTSEMYYFWYDMKDFGKIQLFLSNNIFPLKKVTIYWTKNFFLFLTKVDVPYETGWTHCSIVWNREMNHFLGIVTILWESTGNCFLAQKFQMLRPFQIRCALKWPRDSQLACLHRQTHFLWNLKRKPVNMSVKFW